MAKNFRELEDKLSPESRARVAAKTLELKEQYAADMYFLNTSKDFYALSLVDQRKYMEHVDNVHKSITEN